MQQRAAHGIKLSCGKDSVSVQEGRTSPGEPSDSCPSLNFHSPYPSYLYLMLVIIVVVCSVDDDLWWWFCTFEEILIFRIFCIKRLLVGSGSCLLVSVSESCSESCSHAFMTQYGNIKDFHIAYYESYILVTYECLNVAVHRDKKTTITITTIPSFTSTRNIHWKPRQADVILAVNHLGDQDSM